jgi:hypothetical protein
MIGHVLRLLDAARIGLAAGVVSAEINVAPIHLHRISGSGPMRRILIAFTLAVVAYGVIALLLTSNSVMAQAVGPIVGQAERSDTSKPLRELVAKPADKDLDEPTRAVLRFLNDKYPDVQSGSLDKLTDADLARAFPKAMFYQLRFRQYPVAFAVPEGLSAGNVVVLVGEKIELVTDIKGLEMFFRESLPAVMSDDEMGFAAKAWLRLVQELNNDGFFQFKSLAEEKIEVVGSAVSGTSHVVPQGGNKGQISMKLTFDKLGRLATTETDAKLTAGIRPICQATKLLHEDPIVRRMAERDILVMGPLALEYLLEQRAKANPELQRAIDGIWDQILAEER